MKNTQPPKKTRTSHSPTMLGITAVMGPRAVEVEFPAREDYEALIRVERVGICGTDVALFAGYSDFLGTIGHEFSGVVEQSGNGRWTGKRVTASINLIPEMNRVEKASFDLIEAAKHHPDRKAIGIRGMNGAMAEYLTLPESILIELPDWLSFAEGAMVEPLAAAAHAVNLLPHDNEPVLIIGDGKLAHLAARVLLARRRKVHAIGKNPEKVEKLRKVGVKANTREELRLPGKYKAVIEMSGSPDGLNTAISFAAPHGTVVVKSTINGNAELDLSYLVVNEIKLLGSRCGDLHEAMHMIADRSVLVQDLITAVYPLEQAEEAFRKALLPESLKIQISPNGN